MEIIEKPVPYWPGYYARSDGTIRRPNGVVLMGSSNNNGYRCFRAKRKNWRRFYTQWVHRFVALAWVPNPRPDIFVEVDHIDRDPNNNKPSNLRWLSRSLNMLNNGARNTGFDSKMNKYYSRVTALKKVFFFGLL